MYLVEIQEYSLLRANFAYVSDKKLMRVTMIKTVSPCVFFTVCVTVYAVSIHSDAIDDVIDW